MKKLITVTRFNDKATRIYEVPEENCWPIETGDVVEVETRYGDHIIGKAASPVTLLDDEAVTFIRTALRLDPDADFLKVTGRYAKCSLETEPQEAAQAVV